MLLTIYEYWRHGTKGITGNAMTTEEERIEKMRQEWTKSVFKDEYYDIPENEDKKEENPGNEEGLDK